MAGLLVAQSSRLSLHRFDVSDAADFKRMNDDPNALQYTGDNPFADVDEASRFIRAYDHYQQHGFGRWSIYLNDGRAGRKGCYGGFCGLRYNPTDDSVDLGFRVPVPLWRQGIAIEASRLALELGFDHYRLDTIVANAMATNLASVALLQRLGMRPCGDWRDPHGHWRRFQLSRSQWHGSLLR